MLENVFSRRAALRRLAQASALALVGAAALTGIAHAQANPAVAAIVGRGSLVVGVQVEQPPWGYTETNGDLVGYDIDVAKALAAEMGVPVRFEGVTTNNRTAQLMTGKVDLLIAVVGMYPDRAKVVLFSKPYATLEINLISKHSRNITGPDDLKGLTVGVARGAAQDTAITPYEAKGTTVKRYEDQPQSAQALLSGQVDAIADNSTHNAVFKKMSDPADPFESKFVFSRQFMGIAMRPGETDLKSYVDAFIDKIKADGELQAINQKWLSADMPDFPDHIDGVPF